MLWLERRVAGFAAALSTTLGFCGIMLTVAVGIAAGLATGFTEAWAVLFTTYLSLAAIVIASSILILQRRDTAAIQAKLDQIILSGESDNRLIGIDLKSSQEIAAMRSEHQDAVSTQNSP
jgi:low affinity Fe/Cu permease